MKFKFSNAVKMVFSSLLFIYLIFLNGPFFNYGIIKKIISEGSDEMKTFKIISFSMQDGDNEITIPIEDGIIINQENSYRSWVIEIFIDKKYSARFTSSVASEQPLDVSVIISYPDNEPAPFHVIVYTTKHIGDYVSILMKGTLKRAQRKYAESLLAELVEDGLQGEELVVRFENDMRVRPKLRNDSIIK